jgi:hypothetical protein
MRIASLSRPLASKLPMSPGEAHTPARTTKPPMAPKPGRQSGVSTRRHSQKETLRPDRLPFPPFLLPIIWQPQGRLCVPSLRDPNQQKTFLCANGQRSGDQLVLRGVGLAGSAGASIRDVPDTQTSTSCCAASSLSSELKSSHAVNMRSHTFLSRSFWNSAVANRSLFAALDRDPCFRTTRHSGYVGRTSLGWASSGRDVFPLKPSNHPLLQSSILTRIAHRIDVWDDAQQVSAPFFMAVRARAS